jgi:Flp pilus assembly protein TadD
MIAACAETSVGGMPSPTGNLAARSDSESAANAKAGNTTQSAAQSAASAQSLIRLGDASRAAGDRTTAISFYHRATLAAPEDLALQIEIGFTLHELGAFAEADGAFRRALVVAPRNADALRGLGITLVARDMPRHAMENFTAAIAAGGDSRAYNALGVARDMIGDRGAAQKAYAAGLRDDPENLTLLNNLGLSLALSGRLDEAIEVLGRVAANANATPRHRQNLALAYGLAGRPDLAADVSNNDLALRDVQNNLGYYAWLREQPTGDTSVSTVLSSPAPGGDMPAGNIVTAEAAIIAPPPPLAAANAADTQALPVEESAAESPIQAPRRISPIVAPATGTQTADMAAPGSISGTPSGEGDTAWELTDVVDETPVTDETKKAAAGKPAPAYKPVYEQEANAVFETAAADAGISGTGISGTGISGTGISGTGLSDEIADAIILAPASELALNTVVLNTAPESAEAVNTEAAFDGSAYSRRLEGALEIAIQEFPQSADSDTDAARPARPIDLTVADMTASKAQSEPQREPESELQSEAGNVAAPSFQLAMGPEDGASDTASDSGPAFARPRAEAEPAPAAPNRFATKTMPAPLAGAAAAPTPASPKANHETSHEAGHKADPMTAVIDSITATATDAPTDEATDAATLTPPETAQEMALNESGPPGQQRGMAVSTGPGQGPGQGHGQGANGGQADEIPATGPLAEAAGDPATADPYAEPGTEQLAQYQPPGSLSISVGEPGNRSPPSTDAATEVAAEVAAAGGMPLGAMLPRGAGSGPNFVMLGALGGAMFLIVALLALGRLRQRTGVPEPE